MKAILFTTCLTLLFVSCEDVIEIDLDTMESRLVVEGCITDTSEFCTVKLSQTGDYFGPGTYPPVTDARVTITHRDGVTELDELSPGIYRTDQIHAMPGDSYELDILAGEESCYGEVTMPSLVEIDTLFYTIPPSILEMGDGYMVFCQVLDPAGERNSYRMKAYRTSDPQKAADSKVLFNDDFTDGNPMAMGWELEAFLPGDTVVIELQTLDPGTYDFYRTMFSVTGSGLFASANPANPISNLSGGTLGYFGTYTASCDTLVIY